MGFLFVILGVWAVAMVAWFMVSKYFKASDIDRVKARLLGTGQGQRDQGQERRACREAGHHQQH